MASALVRQTQYRRKWLLDVARTSFNRVAGKVYVIEAEASFISRLQERVKVEIVQHIGAVDIRKVKTEPLTLKHYS
jgi:hypothetical protein